MFVFVCGVSFGEESKRREGVWLWLFYGWIGGVSRSGYRFVDVED